jgi:hypothetical protein
VRTFRQVLGWTFAIAVLVIVLEHAGGFSTVLASVTKSGATGFKTLVGKA